MIWLAREGVCSRCRMDEWFIEDLIHGAQKRTASLPNFAAFTTMDLNGIHYDQAVVILPAGNHLEHVDWVNQQIGWVGDLTLILTSDEGQHFPIEQLRHPNMKLWVQTPRPEVDYPPDTVFFGVGSGRAWEEVVPTQWDTELVFIGQRTHERRQEAIAEASRVLGSFVVANDQFFDTAGGLSRTDYLRAMMSAKWAPCPTGIETQDSFRFYEGLECGATVIHDALRPDGKGRGYWNMVAPGFPNGPIEQWRDLSTLLPQLLPTSLQLQQHAWWHQRRRQLAGSLAASVGAGPSQPLTVVMPTSPIPSHPALDIIDETIRSIRDRTAAEILVMCDGVRPEQYAFIERYTEYRHALLQAAERKWWNVTPFMNNLHLHQARMTQCILDEVDSEYVMFIEHDTPLVGEIDFDQIIHVMDSNQLNLMRFSHEVSILPDHEHLMAGPVQAGGWRPTMQWSQRPHIARTEWYRKVLAIHFAAEARTMIEDVMFGVVEYNWLVLGAAAWNDWRLAIWHPQGNIQRSLHLDGRAGEPKYDDRFRYRYPGGTEGRPAGSPHPQIGV